MNAVALVELQRALWSAVRGTALPPGGSDIFGPPEQATERLGLVRGMYWQRQGFALERSFPRLVAHTGLERFRSLGRSYLAQCPSTSFDIERIGDRMPAWLRGRGRLVEADIAAVERASWESFVAPDDIPWPPTELPPDFTTRVFRLARHVRLLEVAAEALAAFPELPRPPDPTAHVLVHRQGFAVRLRIVSSVERCALDALGDGRPMHEVCATFMDGNSPEAEAARLVATWFSSELVAREPARGDRSV